MTAIIYHDCEATSPNGKFTLEARSPFNGTINRKNGGSLPKDDFRVQYPQHQDEFRYRLIDNTRTPLSGRLFGKQEGLVVWERWQERDEDSPSEVVVSDDGWSILRTHGFRPELVVVSPRGKDVLRVGVTGSGSEHKNCSTTTPACVWSPERMGFSTAGLYWAQNSWRYFFRHQNSTYFVWRTYWGQRLLLDLSNATLLPQPETSDPLFLALVEAEKQTVCDLLSAFSDKMDEVKKWFQPRANEEAEQEADPRIRFLRSAFHLVGVHRIASVVSLLRDWEEIDYPSVSMGSHAMVECWWLEVQYFRPILHLSLRLLGQEPLGYPTYHFRIYDGDRFSLPERVAERRTKATRVSKDMPAETVLQMLGSPDFVKQRSVQVGEIYRWSEDWEYDFRVPEGWKMFRITWGEKEGRKGRILQIETVPSYWLDTDEREQEILHF